MLIQYLQRKLPLIPKETAYAWAHVDDVARGHILAMERGQTGQNYFLAGPVHTMEKALEIAAEITGIPPPRLRVSPHVLRAAAGLVGVLERVIPMPLEYSAETLRVLAGVTYVGSHQRAKDELGWAPRQLREGLAETLRHEMAILKSVEG